ncbi:MAG: hypothetical protein ACRDPC_01150 [Solirubrobacteraceae bacterium]
MAGRLTAAELSLALVLPLDEARAAAERLVARGHFVRSSGERFGIGLPSLERLAAFTRPLADDLDAVAARLSPEERRIVGRFLEEVVLIVERHADEAARRAIEPPGGDQR